MLNKCVTQQQITALESIFTGNVNINDIYGIFKAAYNDIFNEYLIKTVNKKWQLENRTFLEY